MGKAQEKIEELDNQIAKLSQEKELAINEAKKERVIELGQEIENRRNGIDQLDEECSNLHKTLKTKSSELTSNRSNLEALIAEKKSLETEIGKKVVNRAETEALA